MLTPIGSHIKLFMVLKNRYIKAILNGMLPDLVRTDVPLPSLALGLVMVNA